MIQFGLGARRKLIRASITGDHLADRRPDGGRQGPDQAPAVRGGPPGVLRGAVVRAVDDALERAARIRGPVVIKPLDGNHGRGVNLDLRTPDRGAMGVRPGRPPQPTRAGRGAVRRSRPPHPRGRRQGRGGGRARAGAGGRRRPLHREATRPGREPRSPPG
ncbi:hypothetical protein ACRAWD_26625 [Caulobacter segnis]